MICVPPSGDGEALTVGDHYHFGDWVAAGQGHYSWLDARQHPASPVTNRALADMGQSALGG